MELCVPDLGSGRDGLVPGFAVARSTNPNQDWHSFAAIDASQLCSIVALAFTATRFPKSRNVMSGSNL